MKFSTLLLSFSLVMISLFSNASGITIQYYSGKIEYKKSSTLWMALLSSGLKLEDKDSVKLQENAQLIFKDQSGKILAYKKTSSLDVSTLQKRATSYDPQKSISGDLMSYVFHEVKGNHEKPEELASRQVMNIGGVSRGRVEPFLYSPLPNTLTFNSNITFKWTGQKEGFVTFNIFRDEALKKSVFSKRFQDSSITITPNEVKLDTGHVYYWKVTSLQQQNTDVWPFKILSASAVEKVNAEFKNLEKELDFSEAFNEVVKGMFFERKQLLLNAEEHYQNALKLEPTNEKVSAIYKAFRANYK